MTYEPPFVRTAEIERLGIEIAEMVGVLTSSSELSTSPQLHRKLRIRTIHSSLLIEGNSLSENEVIAVLDGKRVLGKADDIREVQNAKRAYDLMESLDPLSLDDLLRVHKVMMEGLVKEAEVLRSRNVGVFDGDALIHAGTPATYVSEVMGDLFGWLAVTDTHPLVASCAFHYEFEFIHPFADGNGRVGRLWHTLLLSRWRPVLAWLPVESVIRDRQQGYYEAIAQSNAIGSCEAFICFMLEVIRDAMRPYVVQEDEKLTRQTRVLALLAEKPELTVKAMAAELGISQRTAERTLADLRNAGKLIRKGSARAGAWEIANPDAHT